MNLPFSKAAFLDVFGAYNRALWPIVIVLWAVMAGMAVRWWRQGYGDRSLSALLAVHWAWSGVAYHWFFFRSLSLANTVGSGPLLNGCLSPRAADGRAAPLFDRTTGTINREVADYWRRNYDISHILTTRSTELAPKLRGKIHIIVGTQDTFHLDEPVRLLETRLKPLGYEAKFTYLDRWDHFALVKDGKEVDRFNTGVMTRIAMQMYERARPKSAWVPKVPLHPASDLVK